VITAIVARTQADERGIVQFRLPAAPNARTHELLVHGETSGTTIPLDHLPRPARPTGPGTATQAPDGAAAPESARPPYGGHGHDVRRRPGPRSEPAPTRPAPGSSDVPDAGLGAL
jgi:hypothetical protein